MAPFYPSASRRGRRRRGHADVVDQHLLRKDRIGTGWALEDAAANRQIEKNVERMLEHPGSARALNPSDGLDVELVAVDQPAHALGRPLEREDVKIVGIAATH